MLTPCCHWRVAPHAAFVLARLLSLSMREFVAPSVHLYVKQIRYAPDAESLQYYDQYEIPQSAVWTVNCVNTRDPHKTVLPVSFATRADAVRAALGLVRAGLGNDEALFERIKVQHDWAGVRRVMIESLNW